MRSLLRLIALIILVVVIAAVAVVLVLTAQQQGLLPWLQTGYQNRATIVLDSVQQMSVLTTTRFNYSSIITSERQMPGILAALYGERQVLVAVGHVTGGIDLSQLTENNITIDGGTIRISLPAPALQDCFLNEGASYVAERDTGLFAANAPNLEGQARQYAIAQFRQSALEGGILDEVNRQAQIAIGQFVSLLNLPAITAVNVTTTPPDPNAPLPPSCQ